MIVRVIEVSLRGLPILFFCCFVFFVYVVRQTRATLAIFYTKGNDVVQPFFISSILLIGKNQ